MVQDENHHEMYRKTIEGVTHLLTRISHGAREIDDHRGGLMASQCCLQLREFWNLVDCPLSEEDWDRVIRKRCSGATRFSGEDTGPSPVGLLSPVPLALPLPRPLSSGS
jgi:hypothetical protein